MSKRRYVMIGAPVTTVRTPPLLGAWMAERDVEAEIEVRNLEAGDLAAFMADIRAAPSLHGLLVTMPHKRAIVPHLCGLTAVARRAGSVNAVKRLETGELVGAQFDGVALVNALLAKGAPVGRCRILLAGVGGAGLAIAQALVSHGFAHLAVMERDPVLRARVVESLRRDAEAPVVVADESLGGPFDLLVNATPLGMRADDPPPFPSELVAAARWIADIVADPPRTRLAALAREAGSTLISGRDMVQGQVAPIGRWLLDAVPEQ